MEYLSPETDIHRLQMLIQREYDYGFVDLEAKDYLIARLKMQITTSASEAVLGYFNSHAELASYNSTNVPCSNDHNNQNGGLYVGNLLSSILKTTTEPKDYQFENLPPCPKRMKTDYENYSCPKLMKTSTITAENLKEHILSLGHWDDQSELDEEKENNENICQLCGLNELLLAQEPINCSCCHALIKESVNYFGTPNEDSAKYNICTLCYRQSRGRNISVLGVYISKRKLLKKKNDAKTAESWVQCDKCDGWQHQVCGLYNRKNDLEGKAKYICPKCLLKDLETKSGVFTHSTGNAFFEAKDLPKTKLSNHIEQRLFRRLNEERENRAKVAGKRFNEVEGVENLAVRVIFSVKKKVAVKKPLLDIFQDMNYPTEFPYTSKIILLFQKIKGVDVCIFALYVQEFGSECSKPNQRSVYISYIDSVKYFTPNVQTGNGEALRTFVYHELLIGYLDFVKRRGFANCYIWSCPPLKGDDYILYCHPKTQKIPKSDKLRQWYLSMLSKAEDQHIVVKFTNFYKYFFIPSEECDGKITAARLPCFEGDFWSGVVENIISNIDNECKENLRKKPPSFRTLQSMGHTKSSDATTKDILLMQKLGEVMLPVKEDFIVIHLQHVCTHCHELILSGTRWFCGECKNFHLCERCHDMKKQYSRDTHTSTKGEKHSLSKETMNLPSDTKDEDDDITLDKNLLEDRHKFFSFCQKNNYQFDTLRRAKHSTMMILYYLLNPD